MRKLLLIAVLATVVVTSTAPRSDALTLYWEAGFRGGVSLSHFKGADKNTPIIPLFELVPGDPNSATSIGADVKPGLAVDLWAKAAFNEHVGIRAEVGIIQKGGKETFQIFVNDPATNTLVLADIEESTSITYITLPLLAVFTKYNENYTNRFGLYGGVSFNFPTSAKSVRTSGDFENEVDFKDVIKSPEIDGVIGFEAYFRIGYINFLTLDARYIVGFSSMWQEPGNPLDITNSTFVLSMGVGFPLGREPLPEEYQF